MAINKPGDQKNDQEVVNGAPYRVAADVEGDSSLQESIPGISTRIRYKIEDAYDLIADKSGEYTYKALRATPGIGHLLKALEQMNKGSSMQHSQRSTRREERELSRSAEQRNEANEEETENT
jgi:hypothetical protein